MPWKEPTPAITARLGVSDVAIGKWCRTYGVHRGHSTDPAAPSVEQDLGRTSGSRGAPRSESGIGEGPGGPGSRPPSMAIIGCKIPRVSWSQMKNLPKVGV